MIGITTIILTRINFVISTLMVCALCSFAQICVDGNYCPNQNYPGGVNCKGEISDEWGLAMSSGQLQSNGSNTCRVKEIFGFAGLSKLYFGLEVGNSGAAFFYVYLNVDCDDTNNDLCHNGADTRVKFRIDNNGLIDAFDVQEYSGPNPSTNNMNAYCLDDNSAGGGIGGEYTTISSSSVITKKGNIDGCTGSTDRWLEIGFDIDAIVDACNPNSICKTIEITAIASQDGEFENSNDCETFDVSVLIPVNSPPIAIIDPVPPCIYSDDELCFNGANSTDLDSNIDVYQWDFDYDGLTFDVDAIGVMPCHTFAPGNYTAALRVVDLFSCSDIAVTGLVDFIVADANDRVTAFCVDDAVTCATDMTGVISVVPSGGAPGYTYLWSNGKTVSSQSGLGIGNYMVTVTDANGCFAICSAEITTAPYSCSINQTLCDTNDLRKALAMVNGGLPPFKYLWNTGATTTSIENLQAGLYTLTVTDDNECETACQVQVNQCFRCDTTCETSFARLGGLSACFDQFGFIDWGWTNGLLMEGNYTLDIYTNADQCSLAMAELAGVVNINYDDDTVKVTYEVYSDFLINLTNVYIGCDAIPLNTSTGIETVSPGEYPYQHNLTNSITDTFIIDISALPCEGVYVIAHAELCRPNPMNCSIVGMDAICFGSNSGSANATVIGGNPPYSFLWSTGATTKDLTSVVAGNHTLSVTDAGNCLTTCAVNVSESPELTCMIVGTDVTCNTNGTGAADAQISGGVPGYSYLWSNGATTQDLTNLTVGNYLLTVTDSENCATTCQIAVDGLICDIRQSDCDVNGLRSALSSVTGGTAPFTYFWSTGESTANIHGLIAGRYELVVTDANDCETECEVYIDRCNVCDGKCKTSFARLDGKDICFDQFGFDQWGWSNGLLSEGQYEFDLYANALQCDLNVGELVGQVSVDYVDDSVEVSYTMVADYFMTLVSIYIGCDVIPLNNGVEVVTPSQYAFQQVVNEVQTFTTKIGVNQLPCEGIYIIAHAEVCEPDPMTCEIVGTDIDCNFGSTGFAAVVVNGGQSPYRYLWSNGVTNNVVGGLLKGFYEVTVADANNCTTTCEVWLAHERIDVEAIGPFCQNDAPIDLDLLLNNPALMGNWLGSGVVDDIFYPSDLTMGIYTIYYDDVVTCQSASLDIEITKNCCPLDYLQANGRMLIGTQQTPAHYETDGILQSNQTIEANTVYDSQVEICLFGEFEVQLGTTFDAIIDGCP